MTTAIQELRNAGLSMEQIEDGALAGTLALATGGALAVEDAAEIVAEAITQFNLDGTDAPAIAALLTNGGAE